LKEIQTHAQLELIPDPIPLQSGDRSRKSKWR